MTTDYFQSVRRDGSAAVALLAGLPDINMRDIGGENLLHAAIAYGNSPAARELLRLGIDVNAQDAQGRTPLHYASAYQNAELASEILKNGGNLSIVDSHGNTPLWDASFNARGRYVLVELFVRHDGSKVARLKNKHGRSPIDFATQIGDTRLVALLEG